MASIFRKTRSPFWFAAFRDIRGQRRQRSTKTANRGVALKMALEWERLSEVGRNSVLTEAACRKVISDLHEQVSGKSLAFHTIEGWLEEWLAGRVGTAAARTLERYTAACRDFQRALLDRAKLPLDALTAGDLRKYRDALRETGHSPTTCNQIVKIISSPLEQARRLGLIPINPAHGLTPLQDTASTARAAFSIEQINSLLTAVKGRDWEGCILLGAFCGLRLKDAANLTWDCVDLDAGLLTVQTVKRGVIVSVPLHSGLLQWLQSRPRGFAKAPVLPTLYGKSGSGKSGLSMAFKRLMVQAGVVGETARRGRGAGRTTSTLSFHSTRHFFVSALSAEGVPADIRQRLVGHSDARTHAVYAKHEMESVRAAIAKLPLVGKQ